MFVKKILVFVFFTAVNCQILGSVNGKNCLELKDSNGCCQVAQRKSNGESIIECPWTTPSFICKETINSCFSGIEPSCKSGWGTVTKNQFCTFPYWTTFEHEKRKEGLQNMESWCQSKNGKFISTSRFACECNDISKGIYNVICKDYKQTPIN